MAQSVERRIGSAEVTGPIPVSSSLKSLESSRGFCVLPVRFASAVVIVDNYLTTVFNFSGISTLAMMSEASVPLFLKK